MLLATLAQSVWGCQLDESGPDVLLLEPDAGDVTPPAAPELVGVLIDRGSAGLHCGQGYGSVVIVVERPEGDPDTHQDVGYRLASVAGSAPFPIGDPYYANSGALYGGPEIELRWYDGGPPNHEPIDVTLSIVAVDAGGNASEPLLVDVVDEGSGCGCATGTPAAGTAAPLLLAWAARRRISRRPSP